MLHKEIYANLRPKLPSAALWNQYEIVNETSGRPRVTFKYSALRLPTLKTREGTNENSDFSEVCN